MAELEREEFDAATDSLQSALRIQQMHPASNEINPNVSLTYVNIGAIYYKERIVLRRSNSNSYKHFILSGSLLRSARVTEKCRDSVLHCWMDLCLLYWEQWIHRSIKVPSSDLWTNQTIQRGALRWLVAWVLICLRMSIFLMALWTVVYRNASVLQSSGMSMEGVLGVNLVRNGWLPLITVSGKDYPVLQMDWFRR